MSEKYSITKNPKQTNKQKLCYPIDISYHAIECLFSPQCHTIQFKRLVVPKMDSFIMGSNQFLFCDEVTIVKIPDKQIHLILCYTRKACPSVLSFFLFQKQKVQSLRVCNCWRHLKGVLKIFEKKSLLLRFTIFRISFLLVFDESIVHNDF